MSAKKINLEFNRTYASEANAEKAIDRVPGIRENVTLRYFMFRTEDGRFAPVFLGETAIQGGVHFHFNVVG